MGDLFQHKVVGFASVRASAPRVEKAMFRIVGFIHLYGTGRAIIGNYT